MVIFRALLTLSSHPFRSSAYHSERKISCTLVNDFSLHKVRLANSGTEDLTVNVVRCPLHHLSSPLLASLPTRFRSLEGRPKQGTHRRHYSPQTHQLTRSFRLPLYASIEWWLGGKKATCTSFGLYYPTAIFSAFHGQV